MALNPCDSADMSYDYNSSGSYTSQWSQCNEYYFPKDKSGESDFSYSNPSEKPGNNAQDIIESNMPSIGTSGSNNYSPHGPATSSTTGGTPKGIFDDQLRQNFINMDRWLSTVPPQFQQSTYQKLTQEYQRQLSELPDSRQAGFVNWLEGLMTPKIANNIIPHLSLSQPTNNFKSDGSESQSFPTTNQGEYNTQNNDPVADILDNADQWIKHGNEMAGCGIGDLECMISPP